MNSFSTMNVLIYSLHMQSLANSIRDRTKMRATGLGIALKYYT